MALGIECHTWDEGHINLLIINKGFAHRFHDMKSTLTEVVNARITSQFHGPIVEHLGQQDYLTFSDQIVDKLMGTDLIRQGIISPNNSSIAQPLLEARNNRKRPFTELLLSELSLRLTYLRSEF